MHNLMQQFFIKIIKKIFKYYVLVLFNFISELLIIFKPKCKVSWRKIPYLSLFSGITLSC